MYLLRQENDLSLIAQVVVAYGIDKYIIEGIQTYKSEYRIYYISDNAYHLVAESGLIFRTLVLSGKLFKLLFRQLLLFLYYFFTHNILSR